MNIFLEKNPNCKIGQLVDRIKDLIKGSIFEEKVFIVGGTVRDFLINGNLDNDKHDVDIAVAAPDGGLCFATWLAYNTGCLMTGKNPCTFPTYGTAKLQLFSDKELGDIEIECVQTRKEKYNKESRNPATAYGTIHEDAMRRDLTINALYYNISKDEIWDITEKGLDDIKNHILRTTGEPNVVFDDDPLRILRVIRFSAKLGWPIEKNTWVGMIMNSKRVSTLTQERVTDEINKILLTDDPSEAIKRMDRCNILHRILPSLSLSKHIYQDLNPKRTVFEHTLEALDKTPKVIETRLAALFHDIGKLDTYKNSFMFHSKVGADMAEEILKAMKYSNATISTVKKAIEVHDDFSSYFGGTIPRASVIRGFVAKFDGNDKDLDVALDLIHANNITQMYAKRIKLVPGIRKKIEELDKKNESGKKIIIPINGKDIMQHFGLKPGVLIGSLMNSVKKEVINDPHLTKEKALEIVKEKIKKELAY